MKKRIRIMMVEDHPEYRECVRLALEADSTIELTDIFGTAERALSSLQDQKVDNPDVILLDLNLPGMSGIQAIPSFLSHAPDARIIVLSQSDKEADVIAAISAGACGYLLKSSTLTQITEAIQTVTEGGSPLDTGVARYILNTLQAKLPEKELNNLLTEREYEVLVLLSEGLVKKQVADRLEISITTVATHVKHVYEKLNVQNAPAAVARAFRLGLFPSNPED